MSEIAPSFRDKEKFDSLLLWTKFDKSNASRQYRKHHISRLFKDNLWLV